MSDFQKAGDTPFLVEMRKRHDELLAAMKSGDADAIDCAAQALALWIRGPVRGRAETTT